MLIIYFTSVPKLISNILYFNNIDKIRLRLSLMDEILVVEGECLTIYSTQFGVLKYLMNYGYHIMRKQLKKD